MNEFLFGTYPYIATTIFLLGSMYRYDREQYTWKANSSQLLSSKGMKWGSNLFHVGIILLFFGHLVGLVTPHSIYTLVISAPQKQLMAMIAGGIFGTLCFIGMVILLHRRITNSRVRSTTRFGDWVALLLLFVQLILGLLTIPSSAQHLDGSSMINLGEWAQHILTFRPGAAAFILNEPLIFKLHIFLGLTMFVVFPFTRLVHVWSMPVKYAYRKGYQIVRKRG
ncbi:Respiratory nitrate reductase gamma chain [hydrothermal vent metagenome]|uniref:Respiratory nitrate reductase gamma chain n=1 Tax=hydrothermal vent metagenome TaxID=652676 RepID=A0A3B0TGU2_9ZZZZ